MNQIQKLQILCHTLQKPQQQQVQMDKTMSQVSTASTSTLPMESCQIDSKFTTIPVKGSLSESFPHMSEQQISFNLLQLNLVSMYNEEILGRMYALSRDVKFYLKNRYLLEKLINSQGKPNPKQKCVREIVEHYDTVYVNGQQFGNNSKVKDVLKEGLKKQIKAKFISNREEFSAFLDHLSQELKAKQKTMCEEDLRAYYETQLGKINQFQAHAIVSPNKIELIKSCSSLSSQSSIESVQVEQISESSVDSPKKPKSRAIFTINYKNSMQDVEQLVIEKCKFLNTKNRCPLVLDFGFGKFIYKNDNQVSHELIAMHLIKYINRVISCGGLNSQMIVQYDIIPEAYGALYEFVEGALTVHDIKKKYKGGIPQYLDELEQKNFQDSQLKMSSIRKRFAQTFCGFCLAQYLLDLKDRNNSNIMIKTDGSIFHIDLAFVFNATPGGINFESCPFKFTKEYLNAMGGFQSDCFKYYQTLMLSSLTKLCMNRDEYLAKINILSSRKDEILCFRKFKYENYKNKIPMNPASIKQHVEKLIGDSFDNWRTNQYDDYQFNTNRILR